MSKKGEKKNPIQKTHAFDFVVFFQTKNKNSLIKKKTKRISNNRKYIIHRLPRKTNYIFCEDFSHEPSLDEMRRGLTLPTRQLNASHDTEIHFYEKHNLIWKSFWDFLESFCVFSFIQFLYHYSVILHFWPKKTCIEASAELKSSNVWSTQLFFAPLSPSFLKKKRGSSKRKRRGKQEERGGEEEGKEERRKKKEKGKRSKEIKRNEKVSRK